MNKSLPGSIRVLIFCITVAIPLSSCQLFTPTPVPSQESFDTDPQTVILYLDIHYPGMPRPTIINGTQQCIPYPVIRLWGDNYALLNTDGSIIKRDRIYSGFINVATRSALYNSLINEKFFIIPKVTTVNPAGTGMTMEAKLKNRPIVKRYGYIGFINYQAFIDLIKPEVTPVSEQATLDARAEEFFKQYADCPRY